MDLAEGSDVDVGVNLSGFQAGVSEHFLDVADVGSADVHRGGAGVAEQMTGAFDGNPGELHLSSDPGAEVSGGDTGAVTA